MKTASDAAAAAVAKIIRRRPGIGNGAEVYDGLLREATALAGEDEIEISHIEAAAKAIISAGVVRPRAQKTRRRKGHKITVYLDDEQFEELLAEMDSLDRSISWIMARALRRYFRGEAR